MLSESQKIMLAKLYNCLNWYMMYASDNDKAKINLELKKSTTVEKLCEQLINYYHPQKVEKTTEIKAQNENNN